MSSASPTVTAALRGRLFVATVAWGAVVALTWFPLAQLVAPHAGGRATFVLLVAVAASGFVALLARSTRQRLGLAAFTLVAVALAGAASGGLGAPLVVAAASVAIVRSGVVFRRRPARALVIELLLAGGGLVVARALGGTSPAGVALGLWTFFLVQSAFFLVGGTVRAPTPARRDAYAEASDRLRHLLDHPA